MINILSVLVAGIFSCIILDILGYLLKKIGSSEILTCVPCDLPSDQVLNDIKNEIIEKVSETEAKVSFEIIDLEGLTKISASKEITDREAELGVTTEII